MAITIQVIGVDRTSYLGKNSLRIVKGLGNKSSLTTHFNCQAGTWMPRLGQDVQVYDGATLIFGGVIDQINTQSLEPAKSGTAYIQVSISSNGYGKIPARRTGSVYFTDTACGDIFNNLVVNGLNNASFDENVTVGSITTGITLPRYSAVCKSFKEIFDELAEQSGVQWYIDDSKTINFVQEAAVTTASHTLDESGSFTDYIILGTSSDLQNYCNKVFVRGDSDALYSISTDTAEITLRLSAEGTAYSSGVYGRIISAPDVTTETALSTIGDNALKRYGYEPIELKVRSFTSTWTVGTKIQCYLPKYDITSNTEFLIESLNISRYDTDILAYDMVLTKRKTADFSSQKVERGKEYFEQIIKKANRGGSGGAGFMTGTTGTIDHYQNTNAATATVTTTETTITTKAIDLSRSSDVHITFSAYLQVTASVTVTGKTYLHEGTATTTTFTFQPQQNLSGNQTFAFNDFYESVSAGTTTLTVKLISDTGTITVNAGQAAMNVLVFPRALTPTFTALVTEMGYVFGGDGSALKDNDQYDPSDDSWESKTSLPDPPRNTFAGCTISGKGYAIGGYNSASATIQDNDEYVLDSWTSRTNITSVRAGNCATGIGAYGYVFHGFTTLNSNLEYDQSGDSWSAKTNVLQRALAVAVTIDSKAYIFGGWLSGTLNKLTQEYDPGADAVANKTDMPLPVRDYHAGCALEGYAYSYGGYSGVARLQDNEEYDQAANTWSSKTDMPAPTRWKLSGAAISGKAYALYGDDGGLLQDTDEYTVSGDAWANKTDGVAPARQLAAAVSI